MYISDSVTVINITEEDLKKYGQWPWPRHIMGMLHARIGDAGALLINYNILFAEPDRMSGVEYLKSMPMSEELRDQLGSVLLDTDAVFASVLKESEKAVFHDECEKVKKVWQNFQAQHQLSKKEM